MSGRPGKQRPAAKPVAVPVAPRTAWRLIGSVLTVLVIGGAVTWAIAARVPEKAMMAAATTGSAAGFSVRQVDISGATHQPRLSIYREVLHGGSDSMWLIDLGDTRARLQELPWVKDVSIQRRWPDRLDVRVTERRPAALWQQHGHMKLIDAEGAVLPVDDLVPFSGLPLVVGAGARHEAAGLLHLMAAEPKIAGQMESAQWIGGRRWDVRLKSGETLSLPEGPAARAALARFAEINRTTPLLGRGFVRIDMRIPDKMVVRVGGEPGAVARPRPELRPPEPRPPVAVVPQAPALQPAPPVIGQQPANVALAAPRATGVRI